ncbi:MAG: thiamine-phosphate kinase [Sphingomonadaceae bacterium]
MTSELDFIAMLRGFAGEEAARGLMDDAAVLEVGGEKLILTHDIIVEEVHFLSDDPPEDVGWKLAAVNLSDLAAMGARPLAALAGHMLAAEARWNAAFAKGLCEALAAFSMPLIGGDTVAGPPGAPRCFGLTAIGIAEGPIPSRAGGRDGDLLFLTGHIGDAGIGLEIARGTRDGPAALLGRYRRPEPRIEAGIALAPLVHAMIDLSDGLLIDAARLAEASGLGARIALEALPLSDPLIAARGDSRDARLSTAAAGDDYELLFAAPPEARPEIEKAGRATGISISVIGSLGEGEGISLSHRGESLPLPGRLGFLHR